MYEIFILCCRICYLPLQYHGGQADYDQTAYEHEEGEGVGYVTEGYRPRGRGGYRGRSGYYGGPRRGRGGYGGEVEAYEEVC